MPHHVPAIALVRVPHRTVNSLERALSRATPRSPASYAALALRRFHQRGSRGPPAAAAAWGPRSRKGQRELGGAEGYGGEICEEWMGGGEGRGGVPGGGEMKLMRDVREGETYIMVVLALPLVRNIIVR